MVQYQEVVQIPTDDLEFIIANYRTMTPTYFGTNGNVVKFKNYAIKIFGDAIKLKYQNNIFINTDDPQILFQLQNSAYFPTLYGFYSDQVQNEFMISEFVEGVLVKDLKSKRVFVEPNWRKNMIEALSFIRGKGLFPSDITEQNITVDLSGKLRIIDVGDFKDGYPKSDKEIISRLEHFIIC